MNEIGRRLGFHVSNGRYKGTSRDNGFDGLWRLNDEHSIVVEVKTSDTFRFGLDTIAQYRTDLIEDEQIDEKHSSILIIVGRQNTGDLEAQIRGSKHAWDIRLISVRAIIRLMTLKQDVEDQRIIRRIYDILIPREFTKLDEIIDILFSTTEEVKYSETEQLLEEEVATDVSSRASFTDACIAKAETSLGQTLVRRSRVSYSSPDGRSAAVCLVSKVHPREGHDRYWFAFRPTQKDFLKHSNNAYVVLGCGSAEITLLIPFAEFKGWLDNMNITEMGERYYWHVEIYATGNKLILHRKRGTKPIDLLKYLI